MQNYNELAASVKISDDKKSVLLDADPSLTLIGKGRSAYVFRIHSTNKALKVFFPDQIQTAKVEADIYKTVQAIDYYPTLYAAGMNYLVIDHIEGNTLFECLTLGIPITEENIEEIDLALQLARKEGLNPSDIHLRNIFITSEKKVKIIDVARFKQVKSCKQWHDLKSAFHHFYSKSFFPKKIPGFILNTIAAIYKKRFFPI
ncbi:protein kinase family protein [Peribacillus muralis]|uniref:protein kinase family protein n=1 Tax=Peribacillus muralis TaxID=264697 RepID=UPI001F4EF1E6|nr:protein kinase family protein [Peribacillus muralis]MCK1994778.1 protein kinase family protein [Peribacillus muralis]MCK2015395.1 protein kinase family protein [Peribacillus muralis]